MKLDEIKKLPVAEFCSITLDAVAGKVIDSRELPKLFIYPTLKQTRLEPVSVKNGKLYRAERPFAFTGTNYTDFQLGLSIRPDMDYHSIASAVKRMADWKMSVIRLPLNVGLVQPAEGVFPDDPRWKEEDGILFQSLADGIYSPVTEENLEDSTILYQGDDKITARIYFDSQIDDTKYVMEYTLIRTKEGLRIEDRVVEVQD